MKHMQRVRTQKGQSSHSVVQYSYERGSCLRGQLETVKMSKQLVKLSEESLMREPEEVFDLLEKIGEG